MVDDGPHVAHPKYLTIAGYLHINNIIRKDGLNSYDLGFLTMKYDVGELPRNRFATTKLMCKASTRT